MSTDRDHLPRPDLTPMIDVVFQLLVFFLVSMRFKTLDMKIEADLPPGVGIREGPIDAPRRPTVVARLTRGAAGAGRVRLQGRDVGPAADPATWERFVSVAAAVRARHLAVGGDPDGIDAEVDAAPRVATGVVIRTIDAFLAADLTHVTFAGTPVAATPRE